MRNISSCVIRKKLRRSYLGGSEVNLEINHQELKGRGRMEEDVDRVLEDLRESLVEKEERIKRLVGENITLLLRI
ncbi:hypothetical protein [Clostridium sp. C8-1-8]|uniref:hypothetical protein n=1 Tax=Clostridium sp. C8-1-8 TaxID=2698831 RepID=UPI00136EE5CF|nr:hypothetical protein [Clostridium sp. C8-1-8]